MNQISLCSRSLLLCAGFFWLACAAWAQNSPADCQEVFKKVCLKARELDQVGNNIVHTTYRSVSHFRADAKAPLQTAQTEIELYVGKGTVYYYGKDVTCMQDQKQTVSILPQSRQILVAKSNPKLLQTAINQQWRAVLQDSLLAWTTLVGCQLESFEDKSMHKMVFAVLRTKQAQMGIRQMTIWVDAGSYITRQMEVVYVPGAVVEKAQFSFSEPEWLEKVPQMPVSAYAMVWNKKGQVLPVYKDYEVILLNK